MDVSDSDARSIYSTIARYCRSVDRQDWDGIRNVYSVDGIDHHTGFDGNADDYVTWLRSKLGNFVGTTHILGTHLVERTGHHEALSETYGTAVHWSADPDDPAGNFTSGFRYVDHMVRHDNRWLIRERFAVREWTISNAGRALRPEAAGPRGSRDATDPLFILRGRLLTDG
jgi:SnoaL-like domain